MNKKGVRSLPSNANPQHYFSTHSKLMVERSTFGLLALLISRIYLLMELSSWTYTNDAVVGKGGGVPHEHHSDVEQSSKNTVFEILTIPKVEIGVSLIEICLM